MKTPVEFSTQLQVTAMKQYIAYVRLSKKQNTGDYYGLEAQKKVIDEEISRQNGTLLKTYCEVESGTSKGKRIEVHKAINHCKTSGATLIISKLDRLGRDAAFVMSVMNSGISILFCDFKMEGIAGRLILQILSVFAEYEAKVISERTKAGLAVAKARGIRLGNPKLDPSQGGIASAIAKRASHHHTANVKLKGHIELLYLRDHQSHQQIADSLNSGGHRTTYGKMFTPLTVKRILKPKPTTFVPHENHQNPPPQSTDAQKISFQHHKAQPDDDPQCVNGRHFSKKFLLSKNQASYFTNTTFQLQAEKGAAGE